jgi:hypothetical protein
LVLCCNFVIDKFEKIEQRNLPLSICLLQFLLSLPYPYLAHRRGRWYIRLCIDLEHLYKDTETPVEVHFTDMENKSESISIKSQSKDPGLLLISLIIAHVAFHDDSVRVSITEQYLNFRLTKVII